MSAPSAEYKVVRDPFGSWAVVCHPRNFFKPRLSYSTAAVLAARLNRELHTTGANP